MSVSSVVFAMVVKRARSMEEGKILDTFRKKMVGGERNRALRHLILSKKIWNSRHGQEPSSERVSLGKEPRYRTVSGPIERDFREGEFSEENKGRIKPLFSANVFCWS